jgi:hypothetical protein
MLPTNGFVALLDVLGFSNLVTGPSSHEHLQEYLDAIEEAIDEKSSVTGINFILFSDSIVISTKDDSAISLRTLLRTCSRAFGLLLEKNIAVRGAIAHGQYFREATGSGMFIAGRPIVDAYNLEKEQDWVGISLHGSVLRKIPNLSELCHHTVPPEPGYEPRLPWMMLLQRNDKVPFHGHSDPFDGLAVVPTVSGPQVGEQWEYLGTCLTALSYMKSLAPNPTAQQKYVATAKWLDGVRTTWKNLTTHELPERVVYF